ncbi:3-methyl-2-oxobutanoate hydroxymethyltransferase [Thiomicrorhabdus sp. ZW0627]|uniref:3-methyl-2-oxobutanoate hydroxymethyltransferase n=1 Tax=Thiomicrorhabdus sp. ZW0627 TaxID=3039774 RepID=UPI0024363F8F|nr:3-methyl-2-oxobutanoate hydroxymethyltransferase [Thiomicrorhabdus sp. ZW0627]MDG6773406.1 3-methyl-2-oxobutanoate hydroxymethyltransferase [Thiomicrorhabdus sp. ZW0627]
MHKTLQQLKKQYQNGEKIVCLTAYDASFGHWLSEAGVDVILVGDSLGMVVQGHVTTLPVTLDEMVYHTQMVQRGNQQAWCIADLPFMSDSTLENALHAAARLMKEGGANMVKLEGGERVLPMVTALSSLGIPVCGHLGLLPQSVEKHGYRVQGKDSDSAELLLEEAMALQEAGIDMLVLECVPSMLAQEITANLAIPVIGIGSGSETSGQVLVLHDMLGLTVGKSPKFSKNFLLEGGSVQQALSDYVQAVKAGTFPEACHEVG